MGIDLLEPFIRIGPGDVVLEPLVEEDAPRAELLFYRLCNRPHQLAFLSSQGKGDEEFLWDHTVSHSPLPLRVAPASRRPVEALVGLHAGSAFFILGGRLQCTQWRPQSSG